MSSLCHFQNKRNDVKATQNGGGVYRVGRGFKKGGGFRPLFRGGVFDFLGSAACLSVEEVLVLLTEAAPVGVAFVLGKGALGLPVGTSVLATGALGLPAGTSLLATGALGLSAGTSLLATGVLGLSAGTSLLADG